MINLHSQSMGVVMKKVFLLTLFGILTVVSLEAKKRFCRKCQFVPAVVAPVVKVMVPQPVKVVADIQTLIVAAQVELAQYKEVLNATQEDAREQVLVKIQILEKRIADLVAQKNA